MYSGPELCRRIQVMLLTAGCSVEPHDEVLDHAVDAFDRDVGPLPADRGKENDSHTAVSTPARPLQPYNLSTPRTAPRPAGAEQLRNTAPTSLHAPSRCNLGLTCTVSDLFSAGRSGAVTGHKATGQKGKVPFARQREALAQSLFRQ